MLKRADKFSTEALGALANIKSGGTPDRQNMDFWLGGDIPWVTTSEVDYSLIERTKEKITKVGLENSAAKIFPKGTLLIALYGQGKTRGQVGILGMEAATNQACAAILPTGKIESEFLFYVLQHDYLRIRALSNSGGQQNLSGELIREIRVPVVSLPEQRRIVQILRTWDEAIEKLEALRSSIIERRSWIRSNILSGEIRLGNFNRPWKEVAFSEVLHEHGQNSQPQDEVFSVSVHKGLINQIEHLGRSFSAANTDHYNRVLPGDIVYTKSPTGDFPLGIIKQSTVDDPVIVSPLYGVFTPETSALGTILDAYFESPVTAQNYLHPLVQKGAKNTIAITNTRFLEGKLKLPRDPVEQEAIADFIETDRAQAKGIDAEIEALQRQKRGLMQKLLTGEWRVNVTEANNSIPEKEIAHG